MDNLKLSQRTILVKIGSSESSRIHTCSQKDWNPAYSRLFFVLPAQCVETSGHPEMGAAEDLEQQLITLLSLLSIIHRPGQQEISNCTH